MHTSHNTLTRVVQNSAQGYCGSMNIDALRGGVAPYLFEFECLLAWRFLRRAVAMFSIQFRTEARRERFLRKVVEAAYCVASHREDRKCSFEAPIINISLPGWQSQ